MNLQKFPRQNYSYGPTPIEKLERFSSTLGVNVYIKRDDLLGLTGGGSKTRKLEFLMADAINNGADTIITCGAVQSNHCRLTLAAAVKEGFECHLVLEQRIPGSYDKNASGNNFLYNLLGVKGVKVVDGGSNIPSEVKALADELAGDGRKPYIIPGGGSNDIGTLGYVACVTELNHQLYEMGLDIDQIVCTSGSGGTHSGLLCGVVGQDMKMPIVGVSISRKKGPQRDLIFNLCEKTAALLDQKLRPTLDDVIVFDDYIGKGYGYVTEGMVEAVQLLARTEGILLDPVYTGKCMAGLIDLVKKGYFAPGQNILFIHTGGSKALFAYTGELL